MCDQIQRVQGRAERDGYNKKTVSIVVEFTRNSPATLFLRFKTPHLHHLNGRADSWNGRSDLSAGPSPILINDNVGKLYITADTPRAGRDS